MIAPARPGTWRWALFVLFLGLLLLVQHSGGQDPPAARSENGPCCSPGIRIGANYLLGLKVLRDRGTLPLGPEVLEANLRRLLPMAATPADRVCLAAVMAEIRGGPAAATYLRDGRPPADNVLGETHALLREHFLGTASDQDQARLQHLLRPCPWLAALLAHSGTPLTSPERIQTAGTAVRTVTVLSLGLALALVLVPATLILGGWAVKRWHGGHIRAAYARNPAVQHAQAFGPIFLELFILFMAVLLITWTTARWGRIGLSRLAYLMLLGLPFYARWRGMDGRSLRAGLGWSKGNGWGAELGQGVLGYLAGGPLIVAGLGLSWLLSRLAVRPPIHPIVFQLEGATGFRIVLLLVLAGLAAPLLEEVFFRGALYHALRRRHGSLFAAGLGGLVFALIHPQGWVAVPVLAAIGTLLGLIREWRDSILAPFAAHAFNNLVFLTLFLLLAR